MSDLMRTYQNVPMDLADASLIAVAESRGIFQLFTLDSDFYIYRLAKEIASSLRNLKDEDISVRQYYADMLVKIGIPAVPALIEALKDESQIVQASSAKALGEIGDASAIPA